MVRCARTGLALLAVSGCFHDDPPPLSGTSTGVTTTSSSSSATTGPGVTTSGSETTTGVATTEATSGSTGSTGAGSSTGGCPDGQAMRPFYMDGDGDGFGAGEAVVTACEGPPGTVEGGGDCDDANKAVHPGAVELCNGLVDDDCDGLLSEHSPMNTQCNECVLGSTATATFWACSGSYSFLTADARCQKFGVGARLANVADAAEHELMLSLVLKQFPQPPAHLLYWLGIRRREAVWNDCAALAEPAAWVGVDGSPVTYLPWNASEPNNISCDAGCTITMLEDATCPRENCVELWTPAAGDYNDAECWLNELGYVCRAPL